jgi:hypothetical protein
MIRSDWIADSAEGTELCKYRYWRVAPFVVVGLGIA